MPPSSDSRSLTVLWVSHSAQLGGAEMSLAEGLGPLAARGHAVHVVLPREGPLCQRLQAAASVHVCWHNRWATRPPPLPLRDRLRQSAFNLFVAGRRIARLARALGADLVVSNTIVDPTGALAARWAGKPHIWFLHEYGYEDHGLAFHFGRRRSFNFMKRSTDLFLVNSATLGSHFTRWFPAPTVKRVHYAVDIPAISGAGPLADDSVCRVVLVGRRRPSKGQDDAVAAVGRLVSAGVNVELELVGPGDPAFDRELTSLAMETGAGERVRLVGPSGNPFANFAAADISLTCSRLEAFGRVTIEAMKLGKPVIGAATGATPELVRHGWNGLLYRPGDPVGLADAIRTLAKDRASAHTMGRRGQAWASKTFNGEVFGTELEAAFTSVRSGSPGRRA